MRNPSIMRTLSSGAVEARRLPKASGFQVDSAGSGLDCRAAEPGDARCRFRFAERAREVKG